MVSRGFEFSTCVATTKPWNCTVVARDGCGARARALRSRSRGIAGSGYCINHSSRIWVFSEKSHTHEMLTDGRESMLAGRDVCAVAYTPVSPHTDPTLALMRWGFFE